MMWGIYVKRVAVRVSSRARQPALLTVLLAGAVLAMAAPARAASTGMPACDDYFAKSEACLDPKMPAQERSMTIDYLHNLRQGFANNAAQNAAAKTGIEAQCKAMLNMFHQCASK